ncbi:hypothetical protein N9C34_03935 [Candidatus Marinimicrobia bacterium]|nr:hypothetical protein [Candidatus Neomarinimicrobiota bacterium]
MKKIITFIVFFLISCSNEPKNENTNISLKEGISISIKSEQSVNGISMTGKMNVVMIGDARNTITGDAVLTFTREEDNKSFILNAPKIGFTPKDKDCIPSYYEENKDCIIDQPILFDLQDEDIISIKDDLLKVKSMFTGGRFNSEYDTYQLINNQTFESKFLYRFPENAKFNEDGSFTYRASDSAGSGVIITVNEIQGNWIKVKEIKYKCYDEQFTDLPSVFKVYQYDESLGILNLIIDTNNCPEEF